MTLPYVVGRQLRMHYIRADDLKGCLISGHSFPSAGSAGWWHSWGWCSWLVYIPVATIFISFSIL